MAERTFPLQLDGRLLTIGVVLAGVGATLWVAGLAVGGSAVLGAARKWVKELDQPPSEAAKAKWQQLSAAASAGNDAWQKSQKGRGSSGRRSIA